MLKKIINYWVPSVCVLCGDASLQNIDLCAACQRELPWIHSPCKICALPLNAVNSEVQICASCLQKKHAYERIIALWRYQTPLDYLITSIKFQQRLVYARLLGTLMVNHLKQVYEAENLPQVIIPMPLHRKRLRERGFNQAVELAKPISRKLKIKLDLKNCQRVRVTSEQAALSAEERLSNVKNAFIVSDKFKIKHVAVMDDVVTTGHTVSELCVKLKETGVERIDVWCCARTELFCPNKP